MRRLRRQQRDTPNGIRHDQRRILTIPNFSQADTLSVWQLPPSRTAHANLLCRDA